MSLLLFIYNMNSIEKKAPMDNWAIDTLCVECSYRNTVKKTVKIFLSTVLESWNNVWITLTLQQHTSERCIRMNETLLQHNILSSSSVLARLVSARNKLISIQRRNNYSVPKIVKDKVKIIWALYIFCGLNQPQQSSHQSPHFKILFLFPSLGPPPVSLIMHGTFTNTHTNFHTEMHTQSFHTKTPHSVPPDKHPTF